MVLAVLAVLVVLAVPVVPVVLAADLVKEDLPVVPTLPKPPLP